jgi:hypothetical protein
LINASVQSTYHLEGRFLEPYEDNQGVAGEPVPMVAALMQKTGTLPGADVEVFVEKPGGTLDSFWLWDDGNHGDGSAGDGIYGKVYHKATVGGSYNVRMIAAFEDPHKPGTYLAREWLGSFWVKGPGPDENPDDDNIPTWWEKRFPCMDPEKYDSQVDPDKDGASNWTEWENGTNPCDPDTDDGGERDGSEIDAGRDPHFPGDDKVPPILHFGVRALNGGVLIRWSRPFSYTQMYLRLAGAAGVGDIPMGRTGAYTVPLNNGITYTLQIYGQTADGTGAPTDPEDVMPKEDPDAPSGVVFVNGDAPLTKVRPVVLNISASDELLDGMPSSGSAATIANAWTQGNLVSASVEMRVSNDPAMAGAAWEPLASTKGWTLACEKGALCWVYVQFRDGAGNPSLIVFDTILLEPNKSYLPIVAR